MATKAARFNRVLVAAIVLGSHCCTGLGLAADGARLFDAKSIIPKNKEKELLSAEEAKSLQIARAKMHGGLPVYASITVVQINMAAFDNRVLTLMTPGGKEFQYAGAKISSEKLRWSDMASFVWYGKSARGTLIVKYMASKGEVDMFGDFDEEGKQYGFQSIGKTGRKVIVFEVTSIGPWSDGDPQAAPGIPLPPGESLPGR